jgi:hypothetical protein
MLRGVRARLTVVVISGAIVTGLALAGAALGAHGMTSPTAVSQFKTSNHSGRVVFTWSEYGGFHGKKRYSVQTITHFGFRDGCTKSLTKIKKTIHIRHNRFSYHADGVSIGDEPNDVTIAGKVHITRGAASAVKGTITLSDADCAADPNDVITFKAG